jgi:hypothetical protein
MTPVLIVTASQSIVQYFVTLTLWHAGLTNVGVLQPRTSLGQRSKETGVVAATAQLGVTMIPQIVKSRGDRGECIRLRYAQSCNLGNNGTQRKLGPTSPKTRNFVRLPHAICSFRAASKEILYPNSTPCSMLCGVSRSRG